ncbi:MAG TPA: hypothetical protein DCY51_09035 [Bacteroidetes bacterium]|nr:hypothetical protein [Bacteroidota bacterium]
MKKPIFLLILLIALGAFLYAYRAYNKPHTDVASTEAAETISASAIFQAFELDDSAAMVKYSDKVIAIHGLLLNRDLSNEKEPQIVLEGNGYDGFIRCGFKPEYLDKLLSLQDSTTAHLKGICMGMNGSEELDLLADKDVVLSNCTLID